MKRLYFFDKEFNYKSVIVVNNFSPIVDIISTQNFKITTTQNIDVVAGDICILKDNSEITFIGTIQNFEDGDKKTKIISLSYIDEIFNINGEIANLSGNIISWITDTLTANFVSISDNLQKISLSIVNNCSTAYSGTYTFESENIKECLRNIFNYSGVYVDFDIDFADNGSIDSLICNIRSNVEEETIKLKYNMPIISEIKRTVTNSQNINKLVLLPDDTVVGGSRYEFYLLKDGTISTDAENVNRFENVKQEIQYYASDYTAESLLNSAKEVLGGEQFNHSIGFFIKHNSSFNIGLYKKVIFYDKESVVYNSIITKIQYGTEFDYVELGVVRLKLTDKLQKESSKKTSSSTSGGGSTYVLPQATSTTLGGIIASEKTTETNEVKIDPATGKLYAPNVAGNINMDDIIDGETYVKTENNLSDTLKSNYDTAYTNTHTHSNKIILDNTTASYTTAEQTKLGAISGTNTGDETASTIKTKLGITTLSGSNTGDQDLSGLVPKTTTINGHPLNDNVAVTKGDVGLGNVDNTSDANKPVSSEQATAIALKVDKTSIKNAYDNSTTAIYSSKYIEDNFAQMLYTTPYYANKATTTTANLTSTIPTLSASNYLTSTTTNTAFNWTTPNYTFTNTLTGNLSLQASSLIYLSLPFSISVASETVNFGYRVKVNGVAISSNQTFGAVAYTGGSGHTDVNRVYLQCTTDSLTEKTNYVAGDIVTIEVFTQQATSTSMTTRVYCGATIGGVDYYTFNELAQFKSQLGEATPINTGTVYGQTSNTDNNTFYGYLTGYSNTTGNFNTANGFQALFSNTTGSYNTANGFKALYSNTTGVFNTANGHMALSSNTTGSHNTANGLQALSSNTTGDYNTANGFLALSSNTTGNFNTANGYSALYSNTTGSFNTANGHRAGRYITGGSIRNTISNYSVYIGAKTKALADNQTNEIVIGYDATGHGSNTATWGNTSIISHYFSGNIVSPALTGTPTAPTASEGTNTTQIATTAFVKALGDTKAVQPYIRRAYSGGNGIRLIGTYNYSTSVGDTRPLFYMVGKQGHGNGTSYLWQGEFIFGVSTTGAVTTKAILKVSDGTFGKFYYRHDTANKILYIYIYTGQYSSAYFSDLVQINAGNYSSYFTLASAGGVTGDTVTEGINILYPSSGGEMALTDASNLTSGNVTSWHTKLNDLTKPMPGNIIAGKQAVVVESYLSSDSKTWYRKWSDGWKECGGKGTNIAYSVITLPLTFSNTNYIALALPNVENGKQTVYVSTRTTNQISIGQYGLLKTGFDYYCCGY